MIRKAWGKSRQACREWERRPPSVKSPIFKMVLWGIQKYESGKILQQTMFWLPDCIFVRHDFRICMNMLVVCLCVFAFPDLERSTLINAWISWGLRWSDHMFEKHMIMLDRVSRSYIKNTYIYVCIYTVRVPPSCELVGFEPHLTIYRYITQKPDKYCSEVNKPKLSNGGPNYTCGYIYIYT